jgi:hypothetical protein
MNIEWTKIRPFNGDVRYGFEELVCQLARAEQVPNRSKFIRVAAPDGGVEAYCILSDNTEYGWQAKYFSSMGDSQWTKIEDSFRTAFTKHPNLKRYYICTPLDRQDPRIVTQKGTVVKHFMDVWKEKVAEWEAYAIANGRVIEFDYWGNSELFERLSKPENEGKIYFWFGQEEFSESWFNQKLEESTNNLGKRYTPEINFELPIAKVFEGISRDIYFKEQFVSHLDEFLKNYNKAVSHVREDKVKDLVEKLTLTVPQFQTSFDQIDFTEAVIIEQKSLTNLLDTYGKLCNEIIQKFYALDYELRKGKPRRDYEPNTYSWDIELFRNFEESIDDFINFIQSITVTLSNNPFLILVGGAGIGKSHLLADIANKRAKRNQYSLLLLGQHFTTDDDPWSQISNLLQINCKRDTLLGALNSKAESSGARLFIIIDAINEGKGKIIWKNHLAGVISAIKRFPYLGLIFSLRTSYEKLLIPETLLEQKKAMRLVHRGFANHEYEAIKLFFENYKINQPSIPFLHPEFSNPLFLRIFCEGLEKKGLHEIPEGYEGISTIIDFYLESINSVISEKHNLPFNLQTVQKVIKALAEKIVDSNNSYLRYDEAFYFITRLKETNAVLDKSQLFQDLISEGLLTQNLYWDQEGNYFEGVYISYERFSDHLIAAYLLEKYLNKKNPQSSFIDDHKFQKILKKIGEKVGLTFQPKKLYEILKSEDNANYKRGLIEAISIQLPEMIDAELFEVAPHAKEYDPVAQAFVESIIWRKKETLHPDLKAYINDVVIGIHNYHSYFLNTILLITSHPQNYFNSDFLHNHLMRFSMADRDSWWTQFIHYKYPTEDSDDISTIRRMIDWAWNDDIKDSFSDESIRLLSQTMFWFLASSNRTLRDSTTKALICLLEERINVLIQLIQTFRSVNDLYILQRLYAIAFGCAVRTSKVQLLKELGDCVFQSVFNTEQVIPDILLRDYAREIIEYAIYKGHVFDFNLNRIRPPFKSDLPTTFPTNEETDKYKFDYSDKNFQRYYASQNDILASMITEYGRGVSHYGDFGRYIFQSGLNQWKDADENGLSNLAVKWIIEKYGYNVEKHGQFDQKIGSGRGRENVMEERIGKKYQWIAFYEILARVSDNYRFYNDWYSDESEPESYDGTWEPNVRDIDPTITIKENPPKNNAPFWWFNIKYENWDKPNREWVFETDDLPSPSEIVSVVDPDNNEWLVLEIHPTWEEPTMLGKEKWDSPSKNLWYQIRSYITKKEDYSKVVEWGKKQNFFGKWMPETNDRYEIFSREYYWSPACQTFRNNNYPEYRWSEIHDPKTRHLIAEVYVTTLSYLWEEQFDASKKSVISFYKPSELLFDLHDLHFSKLEGQLITKDDRVICFDPCVQHPTHSCLVIRKSELIDKLHENNLEIFWTVLGEKRILGGHSHGEEYFGGLIISGILEMDSGKLQQTINFIEER